MKKRSVEIKAMLLVVTMGWMVYATAQSPVSNTELRQEAAEPVRGVSYSPQIVRPAKLSDKLIWAGISLVNPESQNKPTFLYGYKISELQIEIITKWLDEAKRREYPIAKLDPTGDVDDFYEGAAISKDEFAASGMYMSSTELLEWNDESIIAFPQPFDGEYIEFVAKPGFWPFYPEADHAAVDQTD